MFRGPPGRALARHARLDWRFRLGRCALHGCTVRLGLAPALPRTLPGIGANRHTARSGSAGSRNAASAPFVVRRRSDRIGRARLGPPLQRAPYVLASELARRRSGWYRRPGSQDPSACDVLNHRQEAPRASPLDCWNSEQPDPHLPRGDLRRAANGRHEASSPHRPAWRTGFVLRPVIARWTRRRPDQPPRRAGSRSRTRPPHPARVSPQPDA
jgi:hypothetical protein